LQVASPSATFSRALDALDETGGTERARERKWR
jgi:hypothetical protein